MTRNDGVHAYAGHILRINLSNGEVKKEPTLRYAREWLGSTGIAIKILYDELKSWVTPYDPANKIVFGTGALMGTPAPGACKMSASTLGPRTGGWASGCCDSYVGGELKCAGYDMIVIEGKAHCPVYLWIQDDSVEIREASHLWGKTTWETLDILREDLQDPSLHVLSIGPAGENVVRGACIIQDRARAFGRCGTGAVMGSKNLKAVVAKGTRAVKVADRERFMEVVRKVREMFKTARGLDEHAKIRHAQAHGEKTGDQRRQLQELPGNLVSRGDGRKTSIPKTPSTNTWSPGRTFRAVSSAADAISTSPKDPMPGW